MGEGRHDDTGHALSLRVASRWLPWVREAIRPSHASVASAGWVWKRSRHFRLWRRRWLILTWEGELLSFEDDSQSGGATERFLLRDQSEPPNLAHSGAILLEVDSVCKLDATLRRLGLRWGAAHHDPVVRTVALSIDAGPSANAQWCDMLRQVLRSKPTVDFTPENAALPRPRAPHDPSAVEMTESARASF
mmetsp:Transcript_64967/g.145946  ORF Transcript_64967/g.145946 Transcript_64967/m.145946 type:complete len:191 (-) Transcript_64967:16-588(-)